MRVFISGAYRGNKKGLWFVGLLLAGLTFIAYITGECVHWDEVGFAVPWHTSEFFQAIHLEKFFGYTFDALLSIPTATEKLVQIYGLHVSVIPILIALFMILHFYLIKEKGISLPYWTKPSGQKASFIKHVKMCFFWSALFLGALLLIAAFLPRDAGTAPQLISSSPFYGLNKGPGKLGVKPTFPISWTHGMNVFVGEHLGVDPDIWGTVIGMTLVLCALFFVPFVDRGEREPASFAEAFAWKTRKWAFFLIALFWIVFLVGVVQNALAGPG
jgi:quinol-cytochrome oxidoreductase complex cytochrome b subunit